MKQDAIIKAAEIIQEEMDEKKAVVIIAQGEVKATRARLEAIQSLCDHPNGYATSCMGDSGYHCPDCKYSR